VRPLKFSLLNGLTAVVWALGLMALIAWVGPTYLAAIGLTGWKGALAMGLFIIVLFRVIAAFERRALSHRP
jgi:membrane protein DedA with SNARE-associated domain